MAKKKKKDFKSNIGGGSTRGTYEPKDWEKEINNPNKKIQAKTNSNRNKLAMKDGWKENEIPGTTKGKKKGDVKLPKLPKAKKKKKNNTRYA